MTEQTRREICREWQSWWLVVKLVGGRMRNMRIWDRAVDRIVGWLECWPAWEPRRHEIRRRMRVVRVVSGNRRAT